MKKILKSINVYYSFVEVYSALYKYNITMLPQYMVMKSNTYFVVTEIEDKGVLCSWWCTSCVFFASTFSMSFIRRTRASVRSPWHNNSNTSSFMIPIILSSNSNKLNHYHNLSTNNFKITIILFFILLCGKTKYWEILVQIYSLMD